ncbi:hypothetical protein O4220_10490 [Rhodococcus ruber]|uniref:Uncharacterized protein n=1 Tax=Rhodococcus ruber TaxID=1830 RepID=A0ABT4MD85_9NOCA|nr:hypothetical protein [Rhodococcus ruber]MCZ4518947.1 hypothetical protein [Rhodococcus ruber]
MPMPPRQDQPLRNGAVHRNRDRFSVETATGHLSDLNYLIHYFDSGPWSALSQMYSAFVASMSFPDHDGQGLDAFNDVLGDIGSYRYGGRPKWSWNSIGDYRLRFSDEGR